MATAAEVGAGPDGRVDLPALLAALYQRGVRAALLEGGPTLAGAFLRRRAGRQGRRLRRAQAARRRPGRARSTPASTTIAEAIDLEFIDVTQVGPDLRITAVPRKREG